MRRAVFTQRMQANRVIMALAFLMFSTFQPIRSHADEICPGAIILHGMMYRGCAVCSKDWLKRKGAQKILAQAQKCFDESKTANMEMLIEKGVNDFNRNLISLGVLRACRGLDRLLAELE